MWMHIDSSDYGEAKVGVATSSTVCGTYNYIRSFQPLGHQSRDMGLFVDDDDTAYLLTEDVSSSMYVCNYATRTDVLVPTAAKWPSHQ